MIEPPFNTDQVGVARAVVIGASRHIREVTCVRIVDSLRAEPARRIQSMMEWGRRDSNPEPMA